jgi:NAD(P)-dependent dehydrogenase (short-subunit alcohol dehydrogenase family)
MLDIRGSVAVITGGAQGIGRALGEYWVAGGGKAVLADVSEERLEEAKKSLQSLGGEGLPSPATWLAKPIAHGLHKEPSIFLER